MRAGKFARNGRYARPSRLRPPKTMPEIAIAQCHKRILAVIAHLPRGLLETPSSRIATEKVSSPKRERASMSSIRWPFLPASAQSVWADPHPTLERAAANLNRLGILESGVF